MNNLDWTLTISFRFFFFFSFFPFFFHSYHSGDQDSVVPFLGSRTLVRELANDLNFKITVPYGAWFHKGQVCILMKLFLLYTAFRMKIHPLFIYLFIYFS